MQVCLWRDRVETSTMAVVGLFGSHALGHDLDRDQDSWTGFGEGAVRHRHARVALCSTKGRALGLDGHHRNLRIGPCT